MRIRAMAVLGITAALVLASTACGLSSGSNSVALIIYTARPKPIAQQVVSAFEAAQPRYRGRVRMLTLGSSELVQRVRAEHNHPQADVWWGGTPQQFRQGVQAGLLTRAPDGVVARIPQRYRGEGELWLGEMRLAEVIFYNHAMVAPERAPKDWDDLAVPTGNRKLLFRDIASSGTMRSIFSALISRAVARTGTPTAGYDFLRALDRNTKDYPANPSDLFLRIQRQEAPVSVWNLQDVLVQRSRGVPLTVVMPASGAPVLLDGVAKIKGGPHGETADSFLDFLLQPSTQQMLADKSFQIPTVPLGQPPSWLAEMKIEEMPVDWKSIGDHESEWMNYWVQNIKNRS